MQQRVSVAPMLDWTDRHFRYLIRLITKHTVLYTEMVTTKAILHGNRDHVLRFHHAEQPLILQLGGSLVSELVECSRIAEHYGYSGINLNVGCPSARVQSGQFGACLMKQPELVANCIANMQQACTVPVSVKTRIGVDDSDSYEFLSNFITIVSAAGCNTFIIHARKAWLNGLSPKKNREIPPLQPDRAYQLKRDFPHLEIIINGGIADVSMIQHHLTHVDGVMLGRSAYQNPWLFAEIEEKIFFQPTNITIKDVLSAYRDYMEEEMNQFGTPLARMARHVLHLVQGIPGARSWRNVVSQEMHHKKDPGYILDAFTDIHLGHIAP